MKKLSAVIFILFCFFYSPLSILSSAQEPVFAQINAQAALYSLDSSSGANKYNAVTNLPSTYFVELISSAENADGYYHINYNDISGYVKKSSVEVCDYEPVTKYASASLTTSFDGQNVNLRSSPDHTVPTNILKTIPSGENLLYYGTLDGTALFPAMGETWYYARYTHSGTDYYGYIYNAQAIAQKIENNVIEKVVKPEPAGEDPLKNSGMPAMDNWMMIVFIICLCIPAVLIVILIFKKPSANRSARHYREE